MHLGSERHWIPPDINNGIINLEGEGLHHGREAVANLWTGETTTELALDKSINALISPWVVGHPQHNDIAEIFSPTAPHLMPNWIELYFWQDIKK